MGEGMQRADESPDLFEAAFIRLQIAFERTCVMVTAGMGGGEWSVRAAAAIRAAFELAAADPAAANALTNEALASGRDGIADYHRLLGYLAECLRSGRDERLQGGDLPEITERALAGGLASLVAQRVDQGREGELPAVAGEAIQFVLTPYVGVEEAMRVAGMSLD